MKIRCINTHQAPGAAAGVSACSSPSAIHAGRGEQPRWRMAAGTGPLLPSLTSLLSEGVPGCGFSLTEEEGAGSLGEDYTYPPCPLRRDSPQALWEECACGWVTSPLVRRALRDREATEQGRQWDGSGGHLDLVRRRGEAEGDREAAATHAAALGGRPLLKTPHVTGSGLQSLGSPREPLSSGLVLYR